MIQAEEKPATPSDAARSDDGPRSADVAIVGGGVIGLSLAWELAGQGRSVTLFEQGDLGREASWAGAGMLPPGNLEFAKSPESRLRALSARLWPEWTERLREETGIDNGYQRSGGIRLFGGAGRGEIASEMDFWKGEGIEARLVERSDLRELEPAVNPRIPVGIHLAAMCQVRNPRHLKALIAACAGRGVRFVTGTPVTGFALDRGRVRAVRTLSGETAAAQVCVAGGAWSKQILATVGVDLCVEPVRGQIVLLNAGTLPFRRILESGSRYLVPRPDGRILVGSTEERAGFNRSTTAEGVHGLMELATELVPSLAKASVERCWAGLRPGSPEGLPYLGRVPGFDNLFVAAGHFRNGLQMSPGTAVLMRQLMQGEETAVSLDSYEVRKCPMTNDQ